ncbi:uncharacterized protein Jarid2 [Periplaneta americana]|uniref:uncharacterized protein Jarid2 n=1 Tax=Periplaneta americana TaxID=6978 RepID=UPI0037E7B3D7
MYAPAFDLRPQPGEMVVSRGDVKRRRKEGNVLEEPIQGSPKRTKVHAQRKFAQGSSNMSSPALTPVKDKDKVKNNGTVLSPELIPTKRPKTEDFLTFLCFRGTPILPPCLDFFNIATVQETPDEEQGSSLGDCSRESTRNSKIASASVGSSRLQKSADRNGTEGVGGSGVIKKFDRSENDGKRKPPTAVQALRRKYQEQRLAKQRASNLKKLAQKVKGKNMVRTRSATNSEETRQRASNKATRTNIVKKTVRRVNIVQRKIRTTTKSGLLTRINTRKKTTIVKTRTSRTSGAIRRDGLRSGGQLPPGSEAGLKSERVLKQPEQPQPRFRAVVRKKTVKSANNTDKNFVSSVSDFSSDDDQPLAKKIKVKPIERASSSRQLARKVIKRIVSKRLKPRMITRSQQQQTTEKEQSEARTYTRPPRKTKEAAAIYMELLGRKLITPEAEADEDSLSIDSFPELPNARRIERRESEIKARAYKEKKEALLTKEDTKPLSSLKARSVPDGTVEKEKKFDIVRIRRLSVRSKRLALRKAEISKNLDKMREAEIRSKKEASLTKEDIVNKKEDIVKKKQGETVKGLQARPKKLSAKLQNADANCQEDNKEIEPESDADKMGPPSGPRRSLRRGSRDTIPPGSRDVNEQTSQDAMEQAPNPEIATAESVPSKSIVKKSKPVASPSSNSPTRLLRKPKMQESAADMPAEETFSDSDEEPLGKLALKQKLGDDSNSKEVIVEQKTGSKEGKDLTNRKIATKTDMKTPDSTVAKCSTETKRKNVVALKAERKLKMPVEPAQKPNDKLNDTRIKGTMEISENVDVRSKVLSEERVEDDERREMSRRSGDVSLVAKARELTSRRSDASLKSKEKVVRKSEDVNVKNKERKSEEILVAKNKEISKRNEGNAKVRDSSSKKVEDNETIKKKEKKIEDANKEKKITEEESRSDDTPQRRTRESVNAKLKEAAKKVEEVCKNKEVPLKKSEDGVGAKKKETVPKKNEDDPQSKRKSAVLKKIEDELHVKKNVLKKSEDDGNSKKKEMLRKSEEDRQKKKDVPQKKTEGELHAKKKEVEKRKDEEEDSDCNKTEMTLRSSDDKLSKKKDLCHREDIERSTKNDMSAKKVEEVNSRKKCEAELCNKTSGSEKKAEEGNANNREIEQRKGEDDLRTKNKEVVLKKNEDIPKNRTDSSVRSRDNSPKKNVEVSAKSKETSQSAAESDISKNKQVNQRKEDTDSKSKDLPKKNENSNTKLTEVLQKKGENAKELCPKGKDVEVPVSKPDGDVSKKTAKTGVEAPSSFVADKTLFQSTRSKSSHVSAEGDKLEQSARPAVLDSKSKISPKGKELLSEICIKKEERLESQGELSISSKLKNVNAEVKSGTEVMAGNKVDTKKQLNMMKRKFLKLKTEPKIVKLDKQITESLSKACNSSEIVTSPKTETVVKMENKSSLSENISRKSDRILSATEIVNQTVLQQGIKTSPKRALDSSGCEDGTRSRKLPKEDILYSPLAKNVLPKVEVTAALGNSVLTKTEEPLPKYTPGKVLPTDIILNPDPKTGIHYDDIPLKELIKLEGKVETIKTEVPVVSNLPSVSNIVTSLKSMPVTAANENKPETMKLKSLVSVRKVEMNPCHTLGYQSKNREPTFRDKVKAKVNMSNEQIEKWLNESYIEEPDHKCPMFDKSECKCSESVIGDDFMSNSISKEHDDTTKDEVKVAKGVTGTSSYLKEVSSQMYSTEKSSSFKVNELNLRLDMSQERLELSSSKKALQPESAAVTTLQSSTEKLLPIETRKDSRTNVKKANSPVKETELRAINSQKRTDVLSARIQDKTEGVTRDGGNAERLHTNASLTSTVHNVGDMVTLGLSHKKRAKQEKSVHESSAGENVQEEGKVGKLHTESKKQETKTQHQSLGKSQSVQDRGGEKKSIFQQRRSFPHKVKERKDFTPSANAFSPENESSVYAFDSEPELPPISTPFRRRARDSRTSSTTTSKSEEDLARLDDEITPPPSAGPAQTVPSSPVQTVSSLQMVQSPSSQTVQSPLQSIHSPPMQPVHSPPMQSIQTSAAVQPSIQSSSVQSIQSPPSQSVLPQVSQSLIVQPVHSAMQTVQTSTVQTVQSSMQTVPSSTVQIVPSSATKTVPSSTIHMAVSSALQMAPSLAVQTSPSSKIQTAPLPTMQAISSSAMQSVSSLPMHAVSSSAIQSVSSSAIQAVSSPAMPTVQCATVQSVPHSTLQTVPSSTVQMVSSAALQAVPPSTMQTIQSSTMQTVQSSTVQTVQSSTMQTINSSTMQTVPSSTIQTVQTGQSSALPTVQSERLALPVVSQPIQTLPLATAVVQIIPTLPITMRPVQVENYMPTQQQQQQQAPQQQQQQQLLLLQNDGVMTTLKTGCTSSTSIAVQVNLDNEPSLDTPSQSVVASDPATPEPVPQKSMECSTQTDVTEEEEDDSEGHLFYIPLQQPPGTGVSLAAPSQQLIQGVAVKLGTEGPTGPNQRVIMRAKLVTKPPNFNRASTGIQDSNTLGIGRSVLTTQHQRPAGMLMMDQKNIYGSAVGAPSTVTTGTYPPVGTVQPTARGRPVVAPTNRSDATTDTVPSGPETDAFKTTPGIGKTSDIPSGLYTQTEADSSMKKPLAMVSAKPIDKAHSSMKESRTSSNQTGSSVGAVTASKMSAAKVQAKERRGSTEVNSPSTSRAAAGTKRSSQKSKSSSYACRPSNTTVFPHLGSPAQMVEAPIFHPTEKEFQDPLEYIDRIRPVAEKFGLCRVVPPPNFKPECKVSDDMRFLAYNQYVHKMLHRWGPNVKEMTAIKKYLATQSISFNHPPWIGGMEVDLPRLYKIVQSLGGLKEVIEKKKWHRVADGMKIPKSAQDRVTKLDDIYCKYLLPYDTLSPNERQKLFDEVEMEWTEREKRVASSVSPGGSDTTEEDCEGDGSDESEECIVKGRNMPLNAFYRIARNTMSMWFRQAEPPAAEVEQEFWRHVTLRQSHVCVHSGSIDSSGWGYGFPCSKNSPFARHPWNLKVLTNNSGSILRSIGPIMGVTVPTLHVGMLFTTCCWYRDPHGLPWVEYLHTGANKIWYGIPDQYSSVFRAALTKLVPRYCKNKTIWLPSDTAMVPPPMLVKHGVSLCHTVQEPGQFILVFPRAFTSSICTGYLVSESVYFAQPSWLNTAEQVFKDIRNSCEPSMFSLERLLFSIATDGRAHVEVLKQVLPMVLQIRQQELDYRKQLYTLGLKTSERLPLPEPNIKRRKARQAREEEGDYECEMCRANLFVSLVTNSHEEGVYCLPHAIELLTKKRHHLKYCKLMYTYDQAELNELIQKLQEKIETKSQRKSQGKHSMIAQKP